MSDESAGLEQFLDCPDCHTAGAVHGEGCALSRRVDAGPARSVGGPAEMCQAAVGRGRVIEACGTLLTADGHCGRAAGHLR